MAAPPLSKDGRPLAVFLMGPTASGKTDLAVELVRSRPMDIVSVDSALVYRGMDIGTAKPGPEILASAPHRLIDIREPSAVYSAAEFRRDALREMAEISAKGRMPLLVGGTMLYFRALQYGLSRLPPADAAIRARLESQAAARGWGYLHARLAVLDPAAARRIHRNDPQRIQRALEVYEIAGRTLTQLQVDAGKPLAGYRILKLVAGPRERGRLQARIERRFHAMLEAGFEQEVRSLWERGDLAADMPSLRCVGYRQMLQYLLGDLNYEQMVERGIVATRQLAKRQYTWLRAESDAQWLDAGKARPAARAAATIAAALRGP